MFKWTDRKGAVQAGGKLMLEMNVDEDWAACEVLGIEKEGFESQFCINSPWIPEKAMSRLQNDIGREWLRLRSEQRSK